MIFYRLVPHARGVLYHFYLDGYHKRLSLVVLDKEDLGHFGHNTENV